MLYTKDQIRAASLAEAKRMIRHNVNNCQRWTARAVLALLKRQTSDEQTSEATRYHNNQGFNGADAPILTSFGKQIQRWEREKRYPTPLSERQLRVARVRLHKYAGQLALIVRETAAVAS